MTHKLGCGNNPWLYYCICDELEAAYRKGRQDAAMDVGVLRAHIGFNGRDSVWQDVAVAAAEGKFSSD